MRKPMLRVVAVASTGGHWVQLKRVCSAFDGTDLRFITTNRRHAIEVPCPLYAVEDANNQTRVRLLLMFLHILWLMLRLRPDVVISTGAAPGAAALLLGKMLGARTIWIDSIANAEQMSMSGRWVSPWADLWLTQWVELAKPDGPQFCGSVL
jgi:UDP-N-acetylglucosamine:LPS N-acetylglucosamine transferase